MHNAIKKIELDLGGKIVSLTPEQAKNLKDALDELFDKEVIREKEFVPVPCPSPWPVPYRPLTLYWEWQPYRWDRFTYISSSDATDSYCSDSSTLRLTG